MVRLVAIVVVTMFSVVLCKPLKETKDMDQKAHHLWKRFINTALATGTFYDNSISKIRTRRGVEEDCEKLELCRLHARSSRNFLAAYELYFVNKENAKLWDHRVHSEADCARRFARCLDSPAPARHGQRSFRDDDYDYSY